MQHSCCSTSGMHQQYNHYNNHNNNSNNNNNNNNNTTNNNNNGNNSSNNNNNNKNTMSRSADGGAVQVRTKRRWPMKKLLLKPRARMQTLMRLKTQVGNHIMSCSLALPVKLNMPGMQPSSLFILLNSPPPPHVAPLLVTEASPKQKS